VAVVTVLALEAEAEAGVALAPASEPALVPEPEAVVPEPRLLGCSCFYGGVGGAGAPAIAPGRWPGPAPIQIGAALILSSCVNFLMHCDLVYCDLLHCVFWFSLFLLGAELPLLAAAQFRTVNTTVRNKNCRRKSRKLPRRKTPHTIYCDSHEP
jgi:hypothetical protein